MTGPEDIYLTQILPEEMRFGSGQIISIVGYGSLFMVSSIANFVVLKFLIARYRKTKSRVNGTSEVKVNSSSENSSNNTVVKILEKGRASVK